MKTHAALAAALAALNAATALHAQTRVVYVDQSAPPGGDGTTWQAAFRTLDAALAQFTNQVVPTSAEIRIAQGTYHAAPGAASTPGFLLSPYEMISGITLSLLGSFGGLRAPDPDAVDFSATPTILSGDVLGDDAPNFTNRSDNRGPVLKIDPDPLYFSRNTRFIISGLTIRGGNAIGTSNVGGGLWFRFSSYDTSRPSIISDVRIEDCDAERGGGMYAASSYDLLITNCAFVANRAQSRGGGAYVERSTFIDCLFDRNSAYSGGGAAVYYSFFEKCTFQRNIATLGGGFASVPGTITTAQSCLFQGNAAYVGGGAWVDRGQLFFCTLVQNQAQFGGGLHLLGGDLTQVANAIFASNSATEAGVHVSLGGGRVDLYSSIMPDRATAMFNPFLAPVIQSNLIDADPKFVDPRGPDGDPATVLDNDYHLRRNSPAIDRAGNTAFPVLQDRDGFLRAQPRNLGGQPIPDLGCYEYQPRCPADTNQDDGVTTDDLLDFLTAFTLGQPLADIDDGSQTNTPDDGVTIEDLLYFLSRYNAGC